MLINYNLLWHHFLRITKQPARCTRWRCYCRCRSDATCACRFEDFCFCFSNFPLSVLLCCINFHSHAASVSLWASSCIELSARLPSHNLVRIFVAVAWLHLRFLPSSWLELRHEACQHSRAAILCLEHTHIHIVHLYDILKHNIGFSHCPLLLWLSCFFELQGLRCLAATYVMSLHLIS